MLKPIVLAWARIVEVRSLLEGSESDTVDLAQRFRSS